MCQGFRGRYMYISLGYLTDATKYQTQHGTYTVPIGGSTACLYVGCSVDYQTFVSHQHREAGACLCFIFPIIQYSSTTRVNPPT